MQNTMKKRLSFRVKSILLIALVLMGFSSLAQESSPNTFIGGYAEGSYSQPLQKGVRYNGKADFQRMVLYLGHNFNDRLSFFSEIEVEHSKEIWLEQAYLQYKIMPQLSLKAGNLLIPMGIINQTHEPNTFNGVFRPTIDNLIIPTTWREMGFGANGKFDCIGLDYQVYMVNSPLSYSDKGLFSANKFMRDARQKAAEAITSNFNYTARLEWNKVPNLKLGLSGYFGKTSSSLYNGLKEDQSSSKADSSVLGISMIGIDAQYKIGALSLRAQGVKSWIDNTEEYNKLTNQKVGSQNYGAYFEASVDILKLASIDTEKELNIFSRYEIYDTQSKVVANIVKDDKLTRNDLTFGLGLKLSSNAVVKADYTITNNKAKTDIPDLLNFGIGLSF
ncbi:hypothetical protein SDC9_27391 [bioreactor metagenome]|uniref:Porin domain-containing protein n=1 Tax=bioreactor metagenome TaxID=1076179 RepID=A0A644URF2_9ZZZZ